MGEKNKKRIIAAILLVSCITSAILLAYTGNSSLRSLKDFAQADSLITRDLESYNIADDQIRVRTVRIDSTFSRKQYRVSVPPGFSKTQLHTELNQSLYPFNISTPGKVRFPQKDLTIYLTYKNTVIRTISVQTDPDLMMEQNLASIMVAFSEAPNEEMIQQIISFGEPISIVLMIEDPVSANTLQEGLEDSYPHVSFWLREESDGDLLADNRRTDFPGLQQLSKTVPEARVLNFNNIPDRDSGIYSAKLKDTGLEFINASEAFILDAAAGRTTFNQKMDQFAREARNNEHPVAIVKASGQALDWLQVELTQLKKTGLRIVPVPVSSL